MYHRILLLLGCCLFWVSCNFKNQPDGHNTIQIDIWYGHHQTFGSIGLPQKWINILGNINARNGIREVHYQWNSEQQTSFNLGSDLHRLAADGDFNIDIPLDQCRNGSNTLEITAIDSTGTTATSSLEIDVFKKNYWPLPYTIEWHKVASLQEVAQIVDGKWELTEHGLRNLDTYYDRVIAIGDHSWKNYQVETTVTFHDFTPPTKGPPTYNVSHFAIASRWPGHDVDQHQPHRKWFPLGATAEFRLTGNLDSCRWRIFDGPKPESKGFHVEQQTNDYRNIQLNKKYGMKHRVATVGPNRTKYSVKLWPMDQPEPDNWDFWGIEEDENIVSGSALLIAHNTSVTIGDVMITSINLDNLHTDQYD